MNRPKNWNPNNTNNPIMKCKKCNKDFRREHNRQIYCLGCKEPDVKKPVDLNRSYDKRCENCKIVYKATSPAQRYCPECVPVMKKKRQKLYKENHKKGYNQEGENNNNWKSGIGVYPKLAFERYCMERKCNRCGSTEQILVHHIDRDRHNNDRSNLEILCKSCHQVEHEAGKNLHPDSPVFKSNKV
jgi:hypothetical protein